VVDLQVVVALEDTKIEEELIKILEVGARSHRVLLRKILQDLQVRDMAELVEEEEEDITVNKQ
jgi:hypothetical protein